MSDNIANTYEEPEDVIFAKGIGLVTDLQVGPDGYLYALAYSSINRDSVLFKITRSPPA